MQYADRRHAGRVLAERLAGYHFDGDVLALGLARGGVPVAFEIARSLGCPLDVLSVRKLGTPGQPELALGAIASGGIRVLNEAVVHGLGISEAQIEAIANREAETLRQREQNFRAARPPAKIEGQNILLVDDGLATGATMRAAIEIVKRQGAKRMVVVVPVAAESTCLDLQHLVDGIICDHTPDPFRAVGFHYEDFSPTTDEEVRDLLLEANRNGTVG